MGFKSYDDLIDALKIPCSLEVWEVKDKTLYLVRAPLVNDTFALDNQIF